MRKRNWTIGCLIACLGLFSTAAWSATNQSMEYGAAPATAGNAGVNLKVIGFQPIHSSASIAASDSAAIVARKAAIGLCNAITAVPISCTGASSCTLGAGVLALSDCGPGTGGQTFNVAQTGGDVRLSVGTTSGNITNLNSDNKNYLTDVTNDLPTRVLLQVRPNGILGTVQVKITHNQGGVNPKIASFTITAGNVGDSQAIHNGIRDAINALSFSPDVVAVTHPAVEAQVPLTYFPETLCSNLSLYFVEITDTQTPGVTKVQLITVAGQAQTIEGTENILDTTVSPTLGTWGILVVVAMVLLSGYWLMRRRRQMMTA